MGGTNLNYYKELTVDMLEDILLEMDRNSRDSNRFVVYPPYYERN